MKLSFHPIFYLASLILGKEQTRQRSFVVTGLERHIICRPDNKVPPASYSQPTLEGRTWKSKEIKLSNRFMNK